MEGLLIGLTLRKAPLPLARCCCVQRTSSPAFRAINGLVEVHHPSNLTDGQMEGPETHH
jgi:hypothetical protein